MTPDHYEGLRSVLLGLLNQAERADRRVGRLLYLDLRDVLQFAWRNPECVREVTP